jgi:hypothetical protein
MQTDAHRGTFKPYKLKSWIQKNQMTPLIKQRLQTSISLKQSKSQCKLVHIR